MGGGGGGGGGRERENNNKRADTGTTAHRVHCPTVVHLISLKPVMNRDIPWLGSIRT